MSGALQTYKRVPLVKRTEYIFDFLAVVKNGYSKEATETKLAERKRFFEIEKMRAVGRGHPSTARLKKTARLLYFTQTLSRQIGLVELNDGIYYLTRTGDDLLQTVAQGGEPDAFLLSALLRTYPSFQEVFAAIDATKGREMILPSTVVKSVFSEHATQYELSVDLWTFDIVRDLSSQLGMLNWFREFVDEKRMQRVFLTSTISNEVGSSDARDCYHFPLQTAILGRTVVITPNNSDFTSFRETLWKEYLTMTKYVPRKPVFYSALRARTCYALRISDRSFDRLAGKLMENDDKYLLLAGGGSLPFSRDSAGVLKSLPPQTSRGTYMIYLKMDERRK